MYLFLLENKYQLKKAKSIIRNLPKSSIYGLFTIDRNAPYFIDFLEEPTLSYWKVYGFSEMPNNRFWLQNYKHLTNCLNHFMLNGDASDLVYNKYFGMDLHWKIGNNYIQPLLLFKKFLEKNKVSNIYLKINKDFISESIKSISSSLEIVTTHISDHKY